ncbi:MAG: hypothetical protein AABZ84_03455 [Pseudomonadota bacterium]
MFDQNVYRFFFTLLISLLSGCASLQYSAEPIEARVVDAETKQPVEGAIVTANWELVAGTLAGGPEVIKQMMVVEAVTDSNGRFSFPAWGPKINLHPEGGFRENAPQLLIFKSGYEFWKGFNDTPGDHPYNFNSVQRSDWNGKTIELKPFKGTPEEYAEHVHQLDNDLEWVRYGENCEWKQLPRMLVAIHRLSERFESQDVKLKGWLGGARIRKVTNVGKQNQCGSAEEFFKGYLP